jgi:hypothetical protein
MEVSGQPSTATGAGEKQWLGDVFKADSGATWFRIHPGRRLFMNVLDAS